MTVCASPLIRADLEQAVPVIGERAVTGPRLVVDQPEVERVTRWK
jgi:hypothetical protein